jgi:hypothetical protein
MTDEIRAWEQANEAYLSSALEWLRLKLMRQVPAPAAAIVGERRATPRPAGDSSASSIAWWRFRSRGTGDASASPPALPPASFDVTEEQVAEARRKRDEAGAVEPMPALIRLAARLGLSKFDTDVLLLCAAMELDTTVAALCATTYGDPAQPYPTFALALSMFDEPSWDALSPEGPLRRWRLIEISQPAGRALTASAVRADERIVNFIKGLNHLDDRVAPFVSVVPDESEDTKPLPPSQQETVDRIAATVRVDAQTLPVQLLGNDSDSKHLVAQRVAAALGLALCRVTPELLPSNAADLELLARLWRRETILLPLALHVDARSIDRQTDGTAVSLKRFLERTGGVLFVDTVEAWPVARGTHVFDVARPLAAEQRDLWLEELGNDQAETAASLAGQFDMSATAIRHVAGDVKAATGDAQAVHDAAWAKAATHTRLRVDSLAQRIDARATWDDIVLPEAETALLRQISAHVAGRTRVYDDWGFRARMNRGLGVSAVFAGESGTGKTMAAEVIANDLKLSLHRIDLSAVVSKWVGESEKNMQRLFNAAEDGGGILFFDEADALFGKRTEVQHSQDRFANIEVSYLLQRMESYRGLVILATNMKSALDRAFVRRLNFIVNFPFPGVEERRRIWARAFPDDVPREPLDLDRLARLNLTGGNVHNVALTAAFMAAHRGAKVSMPLVLGAARMELRKLDKPVPESELQWREPEVAAR